MENRDLNRLAEEIVAVCRDHLFSEKWLVAPSRRVGYQWLDRITRLGHGVLNVRVKTLPALALELASAELARTDASMITGMQSEILIGRLFSELPQKTKGYLTELDQSPGLVEALRRAVSDMRLAGIGAKELSPGSFEVATKGREIARLLGKYRAALKSENMVDLSDVYRMAASRLKGASVGIPDGAIVLLPSDIGSRLNGLELKMWEAIPGDRKTIIEVDRPADLPSGKKTDARLLRHVLNPTDAKRPKGDDTAQIFSAVGEVGEVREVLRRCIKNNIPFDDVEILHTETSTYVPLIYEVGARIDTGDDNALPFTFAEGIPARYTRPARALIGLVTWIQNECPQKNLVQMIQEGLLNINLPKNAELGFTRLGEILRKVPIGFGGERYLPAIDKRLGELSLKLKENIDKTDDRKVRRKKRREKEMVGLNGIRALLVALLRVAGDEDTRQKTIVQAAYDFVDRTVRAKGQLDGYSRTRIMNEMKEVLDSMGDDEDTMLELLSWLPALADRSHVNSQGPRSGCIHVSSIRNGGHSGRGHTFIIGLDDTRFPGTGTQDPLLLDAERKAISKELPTAGSRLTQKLEDFSLLLSRLRGNVYMCFCSRSLADDRHKFASSAVMAGYRILSGNHEGDQESLLDWLSDPVSFAPLNVDSAIDATEWWLGRTCGAEEVKNPRATIAANFRNLGNGQVALTARESDVFTAYDGYVPEAGPACSPFGKDAKALSASRLHTLAKSPMDYFFEKVLRISEPEEHGYDPALWLDPMAKGSLLHKVFEDFMIAISKKNRLPSYKKDKGLLEKIVQAEVAKQRETTPAPSEDVLAKEVADLHKIAGMFLKIETEFCKTSTPEYFEVSIGLEPEGKGSPIDTPDSVKIALPGGKTIRAHGRLDRVDKVRGKNKEHFAIWDYKTGSAYGYSEADPNRQGRVIQNTLYLELLQAHLKKVKPGARVESFGYFFPSLKEYGWRIEWPADKLVLGRQIIASLCEMLEAGCFPAPDDSGDLRYSDYSDVYGNKEGACEDSKRKLSNPDNRMLKPFMALRGYRKEGENA